MLDVLPRRCRRPQRQRRLQWTKGAPSWVLLLAALKQREKSEEAGDHKLRLNGTPHPWIWYILTRTRTNTGLPEMSTLNRLSPDDSKHDLGFLIFLEILFSISRGHSFISISLSCVWLAQAHSGGSDYLHSLDAVMNLSRSLLSSPWFAHLKWCWCVYCAELPSYLGLISQDTQVDHLLMNLMIQWFFDSRSSGDLISWFLNCESI